MERKHGLHGQLNVLLISFQELGCSCCLCPPIPTMSLSLLLPLERVKKQVTKVSQLLTAKCSFTSTPGGLVSGKSEGGFWHFPQLDQPVTWWRGNLGNCEALSRAMMTLGSWYSLELIQ